MKHDKKVYDFEEEYWSKPSFELVLKPSVYRDRALSCIVPPLEINFALLVYNNA